MTAKQRAARAKFKAVVAEAKKLRKKNPKLTQAQAVKQAFAISYGKKRAGVGAVKKKAAAKKKAAPTKVKAKKSRSTEMHTDTKSHNVNIRVISGIDKNDILKKIQNSLQFVELYQDKINFWKQVKPKNQAERDLKLKELKGWNQLLKIEQIRIEQLKKYIK